MRVLFSTIAVLGLLLAALSIFEIKVVREYLAELRDTQKGLSDWERREQEKANKMNMVITGNSIAYAFGRSVEELAPLERGWWVAFSLGGVLFVLGVTGFIIQRRSCPIAA